MRTLHPTSPALILGAAFWLGAGLGCEADQITPPRPDSGVASADGGTDDPLALTPGMTFRYQASLTYRAQAAGAEKNAQFELTLTLTAVNDLRGAGESSLSFTATGMNLRNDDFDPTADFDSFVAQLGPAQTTDQVGSGAVTANLEDVPVQPPRPVGGNKVLPKAVPFFLDLRADDRVRGAFAEAHSADQPQVVDPSQHPSGRYAFNYTTRTEMYGFNYPQGTPRAIRLEYDPRGFLVRLEEDIGTVSAPPSLSCRLTLVGGP